MKYKVPTASLIEKVGWVKFLSLDSEYAVKIIREISKHPRFVGTSYEEEARNFLVNEFKSIELEPKLEGFTVKTYSIIEERLEVLEPPWGEIECGALGFSGNTPPSGVEGKLIYIENADKALLPDNKGWIGLAAARPTREAWKTLAKQASGLIISENNPSRPPSMVSVPYEWLEEAGDLPAVYVKYDDALRLLEASRVRLMVRQKYKEITAYNIVAEVKGTKYPEEIILVVAHYDSVRNVHGAIDNAGGVGFLMALAKKFSSSACKRTIRFVLAGAEELGLRGSLAYVEAHKDELENIKLVVNLDVHGQPIGTNAAIVTGDSKIANYLETLSKIMGVNLNVREDVMSSDSTSFARAGVPAVSFYRSGGSAHFMHTYLDNDKYVGSQAFALLGAIALRFIEEVANAEEFPFPREIPDNIKKKIKEYFEKRGFGIKNYKNKVA